MGFFSDIGDWFQDTIFDPISDVWDDFTGVTATQKANEMAQAEAALNRNFESDSAKKAMDFSKEEAAVSRAFAERMSSTAVSRLVDDAKRAGINPYYLVQGGSQASTPSSAMASGVKASGSMAPIRNTEELMAQKMQTAWSIFRGIRLISGEVKKIEADAKSSEAKASLFQELSKIFTPILGASSKGWKSIFDVLGGFGRKGVSEKGTDKEKMRKYRKAYKHKNVGVRGTVGTEDGKVLYYYD